MSNVDEPIFHDPLIGAHLSLSPDGIDSSEGDITNILISNRAMEADQILRFTMASSLPPSQLSLTTTDGTGITFTDNRELIFTSKNNERLRISDGDITINGDVKISINDIKVMVDLFKNKFCSNTENMLNALKIEMKSSEEKALDRLKAISDE